MSRRHVEWQTADAVALLTVPNQESHKYSRGVLGLRTGSSAYPGAAVLGAEAAWRTGVGLVRYVAPLDDREQMFGLPSPAAAILASRPETVFTSDSPSNRSRCDAWVIGSGTDASARSFAESEALRSLLSGKAPVVVDAGALNLVLASVPTAPTIITPHIGEFETLWHEAELGTLPPHAAEAASMLAQRSGTIVLLKGSLTTVASPTGSVLSIGPATPWLATAGTGDVLAGMLGALVAAHAAEIRQDPELLSKLGATAALLHDAAARVASDDPDATAAGHPITALDVANAVPRTIARLRA